MAAFLNTPGGDSQRMHSDFEAPDFTQMDSFNAPNDDLIKPSKKRSGLQTPRRPIFGDRTNKPTARGEFTPLLKSVHKNTIADKINAVVNRTPLFMKENDGNSLRLPHGDSSEMEQSYQSGASTPLAILQMASSSPGESPLPNVRGKGGILGNEGQLTLREQEKIIDEIKKENWGLKLKIYYLDSKMNKLGPEFNKATVQENASLKVSEDAMRRELKKFKKQLAMAEAELRDLQQDAQGRQDKAQQNYVNTKQAEKDARKLQDALDTLARREEELEELHEEMEKLRKEAEDRNKTEQEDVEEIESLRQQLQERESLEIENEELQDILKAKSEEINQAKELQEEQKIQFEQRISELEVDLQAKEEVILKHGDNLNEDHQDLQNEILQLRDDVQEFELQIGELEREKRALTQDHDLKIEEIEANLTKASDKIKELHSDKIALKQRIQFLESDQESDNNELQDKVLNIEHNNTMLKDQLGAAQAKVGHAIAARKKLEDEMALLRETHKNQLEKLQEDLQERSMTMRSRVEERDENRKRLQKELDRAKDELADMTRLHEEKMQEAAELSKRVSELINFNSDTKSLQTEVTTLRADRQRWLMEQAELKGMKETLKIRHDALSKERDQLHSETEKLTYEMEDLRQQMNHERRDAINEHQAERTDFTMEIERLKESIETLRLTIDDKNRTAERNLDNWNSEKRNLELKLTREANRIQGLEANINTMRECENTLQGKEMRLMQELDKEKARHSRELDELHSQITELMKDLEIKKASFDNNAAELQQVKDDLRLARKSEKSLSLQVQKAETDLKAVASQDSMELQDAREKAIQAEIKCNRLRDDLKNSKDALLEAQTALRREKSRLSSFQDDAMTGSVSQQQLQANLNEVERQLDTLKHDKRELREKLASTDLQLMQLQRHCDDLEVDRDQQEAELEGLNRQLTLTFGKDNDKQELRKENARLDTQLRQMQAQLENAIYEKDDLEIQMDEAIKAAVGSEAELQQHISDLNRQIADIEGVRKREQKTLQREKQRLEERVLGLEDQLQNQINPEELEELSIIRTNLSEAKKREEESRQKEIATKEKVRDLRHRVQKLETELHDARLQRPRSPNDTQTQAERQELHTHLMNARLQIEELQAAIESRETELQAQAARETEVNNRIQKYREERRQANANAKQTEQHLYKSQQQLQKLQDKFVQAQDTYEAEKAKLVAKMQTAASPERRLLQSKTLLAEADLRHKAEIKGLAKQIVYLRAKIIREEGFRNDLAFSKKFMMMQISLYGACNEANLQMLEQMGITPDRAIREKRPTLRSAGLAIIAAIRMKNRQVEWSKNEVLKKRLAKSLDQVRRKTSRRP